MSLPHGSLGPETPRPTTPGSPGSRRGAQDEAVSVAAHFVVEIDHRTLPCARVSGLELASRVDDLSSKKDPKDPERMLWSAPAEPGTLLLTRALDGDRSLYEWRKEALSGKPAVRTVVIHHLERAGGDPLHTWAVTSAWPLRWAGPRYDALYGGVALEELELVFHNLTWQGA